jgi:Rps23 Pro-64 3,4-dihydroxylase Tpa1-like proline 4-hydroxylase
MTIKLDGGVLDNSPFPHFFIEQCLAAPHQRDLLEWLEASEKWLFREEDNFYQTFDIDFRRVDVPPQLTWVVAKACTDDLRAAAARMFGVELLDKVDVTAQKLVTGYRIGVHTDFGHVGQTHRLVVQLNRGWEIRNGGLLLFLDTSNPQRPEDIKKVFLPNSGSGVFFEISPYSYHGVSEVEAGERYTLVYSFYSAEGYDRFRGAVPEDMFQRP